MNQHITQDITTDAETVAALVAEQPAVHSLHQALYNSEAAYRHDLATVFTNNWLLVGHASQAPNPGDYFLADVADENVIIIRGKDDQLRAFANVCRHRGSRVCLKSEGHATVLSCPYHAWTYNLDGTLRTARHMGPDFDKSLYSLKPVTIEVIEGLIFVTLAEKPLSLDVARKIISEAYRPYGFSKAKVAMREMYRVNANWKLCVENYLECYHCAPSHPEYSKLHALEQPLDQIADMNAAMEACTAGLGLTIPQIDHRVNSSSGEQSIFTFRYALYDGVKTGGPDGEPVAPLMGDFMDYDGGVTSTHFAPANFFIAYPDYGLFYRFIPVDAHTTDVEQAWLVRGDAVEGVDYDPAKLRWLWDVTTAADKRITEDNQKGVNSRYYQPGPYAPVEPNAIAWIAWYLKEIV